MSRIPEHGAAHSSDGTPNDTDAAEDERGRRYGRWAIQLWIAIAVLFFAGRLAGGPIAMISASEIEVPLEFAAPIPLPGMSAGLVGAGVVAVPLSELAVSTIVMFVLAHLLPIVGVIGCGIVGLITLRHFAPGEAFTAPVMRAVNRLAWAAFATALGYYVPLHFGANMTTRDLQITSEASSGVSLLAAIVVFALVFALLGLLEIGRQVYLSGKRAQDELEGLI